MLYLPIVIMQYGVDEIAMFRYDHVDETVNLIVSAFNPEKIIIFGSVARGTATDESDLDILVVMDSDSKPTRRAREIYSATSDIDLAMDIIVLTPDEFWDNRDSPYSFLSEIVRTGVVVYEI